MPRVSVIMAVYKEPVDWMRQSIDSILGQTFVDFEFIVVNDCPDREENMRILEEYKQQDSRVVIVVNEENIGLTKSLNRALDISKGEYIARMDADDISLPHRLKTQLAYLDYHPEIAAVGSWISHIDENGNEVEVARYETDPRWIRAQLLQNSQVCHPSAMFRKTVKGYNVKYDESIRYAQDYALWVSILPYGEIANIPEVLFCYRTSNQQITSNKKSEQEACAKIIQKRAFQVLGFHPTDSFLNLFFAMTVQHNMEFDKNVVRNEFHHFFKEENVAKGNLLALEIIYSTYLSFLKGYSINSALRNITIIFKNSSPLMLFLALKLIYDLGCRKIKSNPPLERKAMLR